jgi:hypothetical protein
VPRVSLLTGGAASVKWEQNGASIQVARQDRREIDTIVKLDLDGKAMDIRPIR